MATHTENPFRSPTEIRRSPNARELRCRQLVALSALVFALAHVDIAAGFCRRAAEVKIVLIETGDLLKPLDIEQGEPMVRECYKIVAPKPLQGAVHVHGGQTEHVGE